MNYFQLDQNVPHRVCLMGHTERIGYCDYVQTKDADGAETGIWMLFLLTPRFAAREMPELVRNSTGAKVLAPASEVPEHFILLSPQAIYSIEEASSDDIPVPYSHRRSHLQLGPHHIYSLRKCGLLAEGPWTDEHEAAYKFAEEMYSDKPWPVIPDNIWDEEAWKRCLQESFQARHAAARVDEEGMEDPFYDPALADKANAAAYDAEDLGMGEVEPPTCKFCNTPMFWDDGDDSVGLPGAWYCKNYAKDETGTHPDICHKCGDVMERTENPMWAQYACPTCAKKKEESVPICAGCGHPMTKTDNGYECVS